MPPVQTAVAEAPAIGRPGQEYDVGFNDVVTKIATGPIPFGAYVSFKAAGACQVPAEAGDVNHAGGHGIALIDHNKSSGAGYVAGDPVRCLVRGRAFTLNEVQIAHGAAVFVRHTSTSPEQDGAFRNDADGSDAVTPVGMRWFQGGAINQAVIEVGYGGSAGPTGATGATGATGPTGPTAGG
jgi:hypothetical protein